MANDKNIKRNSKTKVCKCCRRVLPLSEFPVSGGRLCKSCKNKQQQEQRANQRFLKGLKQYLSDDFMHIQRQYKKINQDRILRKKVSGIDFCAKDEKFVKLLYYKDAWFSNYGRCIVRENDEYKLLRGSIDKWTGDIIYTLRKERYIKYTQTYAYKKVKTTGDSLVVENFIVNYDMANNTRIWHLNNDISDGYYKHLYPVTEKQYERLTELQEKSSEPLSEDVIIDVINAVEYKQDGWNPWNYQRGLYGVSYDGCNDADKKSASYIKWKNMIQRCYDPKVHEKYKPEYKDKIVCEEWLNYANFRIWFDEHYVPVKNNQVDLDKDLLIQGNKVYSPETCVFLVHYQNLMFEGKRGNCVYENEDGTFSIDKKKNKDNIYETYEEALDFVVIRQEEKIENTAEKCKGTIPMCAYEAMLNWDVRLAMCG